MNKTLIYSSLAVLLLFMLSNCGDADVNAPRGSSEIAEQIDINTIKVKNMSGTSIIYFDRPDDRNLKYVQAVYELKDGTERRFNSSYYTDSIVVNGFPEAGEYDLKIYSVNYVEKFSKPVVVKINPEQPPYKKVLDDCQVEATFSGFRFVSHDEVKTDLSIIFMKQLENREWEEISAYYTRKSYDLQHVVRGQEAVETKFAMYAMDQWGHKSDTIYTTLTPWYEMEIPKTNPLWKNMNLPTDAVMHTWSGAVVSIEKLWDGAQGNSNNCYHTIPGAGIPHWTTIDLGAQYLFSRAVFLWRGGMQSSAYFISYCPKTFEIYGSNNPTPDGSWDDSWELITTINVTREDGSQTPQDQLALTSNEKEWYTKGMNFDFPAGIPPYRYVRLRMLSTYGGVDYTAIGEMTLYGQIPEE